jgi:hypothetical protein
MSSGRNRVGSLLTTLPLPTPTTLGVWDLDYFSSPTAALSLAGSALNAIAPQSEHEVAVMVTRKQRHLDRRLLRMNAVRSLPLSLPGSRLLPPHVAHFGDEFIVPPPNQFFDSPRMVTRPAGHRASALNGFVLPTEIVARGESWTYLRPHSPALVKCDPGRPIYRRRATNAITQPMTSNVAVDGSGTTLDDAPEPGVE